mmetsp:Transcript_7702/g.10631  ORF Transcript_7702/g.10631 Transcript_7702/m.10631 type:complete len:331 (-) Transcript_7702:2-994(-)
MNRSRDLNIANIADTQGNFPIHVALENGNEEVALYLISQGSYMTRPNSKTFRPIHLAAARRCNKVIPKILQKDKVDVQTESGDTPLHLAASNNHYSTYCVLLERGAREDIQNECGLTPIHCSAAVREYRVNDINRKFFEACKNGELETAEKLLQNPFVDVGRTDSIDNITPLFAAADNGHLNIVSMMQHHQVKNSPSKTVFATNFKDEKGNTALMRAICNGFQDIALCLLKFSDLDIDARNAQGRSILHLAAQTGNSEMVQHLLTNQIVSPNVKDNVQNTPLHIAVEKNFEDVAKFLVKHGASVQQQNALRQTPFSMASSTMKLRLNSSK